MYVHACLIYALNHFFSFYFIFFSSPFYFISFCFVFVFVYILFFIYLFILLFFAFLFFVVVVVVVFLLLFSQIHIDTPALFNTLYRPSLTPLLSLANEQKKCIWFCFGNLMLILVEMIRKHGGGEHIKQQPVSVCLSVIFVFVQNLKSIQDQDQDQDSLFS